MRRSGSADMPLHYGHVPPWLAARMKLLGGAITESIVLDYGVSAFMERMSDPAWFQALGCVMGMDWHSSGITTSVLGALKKVLNPKAKELGIYVCGGRGKHSRQTPQELLRLAAQTGFNGEELVHCSKLTAKVDNTAVQDGFQLYLHNFIVTKQGEWVVIQQGMNESSRKARRYHWHSRQLHSFVDEPHTAIYGHNVGQILNLTHHDASPTRKGILTTVNEMSALQLISELRHINLPSHHDVRATDINPKRLGAVLALVQEKKPEDFEQLLLTNGLGPRTLQSLTLVSEVIHGTPSRFSDPARFSFAHGGKDGHPFPVPVKVYDQTISILQKAVEKAKIGDKDKSEAIRKLHQMAGDIEKDFIPNQRFEELLEKERNDSYKYGGRTVSGKAKKPEKDKFLPATQLSLFS